MFVRLNYLLMIKTGILGTSETATLFAANIKELGKFELTGCFSPDYNKSKAFGATFGLIAYPSIDALFKYTDALIITDFSPDFLCITEKSLKNFKHVLISNPFLAGLEEILHLRKLSEESRVMMQIVGGFRYHQLSLKLENKSCYFSDLRHSFVKGMNICTGSKFMEFLLHDVSLTLSLLKGVSKKAITSAWDKCGNNPDLVSTRLDLDNGCTANILLSQVEDENKFALTLYSSEGVSKFEFDPFGQDMDAMKSHSIIYELEHFASSIQSRSTASHNDIMFQSLELVHNIKTKAIRQFSSNIQE